MRLLPSSRHGPDGAGRHRADAARLVAGGRRGGGGEDGIRFSTHFEAASRRTIAERVGHSSSPRRRAMSARGGRQRSSSSQVSPATFGTAARAIVVPHEVLWRVPFEALPTGERIRRGRHLRLRMLPSVTSLVRAPAVEPSGGRQRAGRGRRHRSSRRRNSTRYVALPRGGHSESGRRQSRRRDAIVRGILTPRACRHSPVLARPRRPSPSGCRERRRHSPGGAIPRQRCQPALLVDVARRRHPATDGTLEAREIMNLDLHARVTIFSDGASMTMMDAADETGAVAWAWRAASVRAIVLPRWFDRRCGLEGGVLAAVHARLRAGDAPDVALQTARAKIRARPRHVSSVLLGRMDDCRRAVEGVELTEVESRKSRARGSRAGGRRRQRVQHEGTKSNGDERRRNCHSRHIQVAAVSAMSDCLVSELPAVRCGASVALRT